MFNNMHRLVILTIVTLLSGCAYNVTTKEEFVIVREDDADAYIESIETGRAPPENTSVNSLGEAYAAKSVYLVRRKSTLSYSTVTASFAGEFILQTKDPWYWLEGIPFLLVTPLAFVGDVIVYPKRVVDHILVDEDQYETAIKYMELARENGYEEKYMNFIPYSARVKHIDR